MPIRSRGELPDPCITAIRDVYTRPHTLNIDTDVYIELSMVDAPDCQIYFTTDESPPAPFMRWIGGREVTFRYKAPFALKPGRRTVKAVAVSTDGLLNSRTVSKTFIVHGDDYDTYDSGDTYTAYRDRRRGNWSDSTFYDTDCETDRRGRKWTACQSWHGQGRRNRSSSRPVSADRAWIASTRRYPYNVETQGEQPLDSPQRTSGQVPIPDGPFNPVNYSGTQINVWGGPPPNVWTSGAGVSGSNPATGFAGPRQKSQRGKVQRGLLTADMMENSGARLEEAEDRDDDSRTLTVADVRKILAEAEAESAAEAAKAAEEEATAAAAEAEASDASHRSRRSRRSSNGFHSSGSGNVSGSGGRGGGNVSFAALARSGKALTSAYRNKKKSTE